jgi:hypothetical protein
MTRAPLGAVISYWLQPRRDRVHIHRIEVEHALYLAAATQEQIKDTLTVMLRRQAQGLEGISNSIDELRDELAAGFSSLSEGLATVDDTLNRGFYQLHLDALGTHARLDDLLLLVYDKEGYRRELAARQVAIEARRALHKASSEYSDAMTLTKRALNESNVAKAGAMLDEAVVLFGRASDHPGFALQAHFQLGYLAQQHEGNIEAAYDHYSKSLGPDYSSHFVRTARHLAHLDYLAGHRAKALVRMQELIVHDGAISAFARDLRMANAQPWEKNACILALKSVLEVHVPLLAQCARLSDVRGQFDDQRCFTATEGFMESHSVIMMELRALRPDVRVYFDAARYAIASGDPALAASWVKHCHDAQSTLSARRAFLFEATADEELRHGEVENFLREAWAAAERQKTKEEVAAAEAARSAALLAANAAAAEQRLRRNAASLQNAVEFGASGSAIGGIVIGVSGCVSCVGRGPDHINTMMTDFNLFNGLLYGALIGAVIGALIGVLVGQSRE